MIRFREVVGDLRFRQAVNMGLDRQEIHENLFFDMVSPTRTVPDTYDPKKSR